MLCKPPPKDKKNLVVIVLCYVNSHLRIYGVVIKPPLEVTIKWVLIVLCYVIWKGNVFHHVGKYLEYVYVALYRDLSFHRA